MTKFVDYRNKHKWVKRTLWISILVAVTLASIGLGLDSVLSKIKIGIFHNIYETISGLFPNVKGFASATWYLWIVIATLLVVLILWKPELYLIRFISLAHGMSTIDNEIKELYYVKTRELNCVSEMDKNSVINAVKKVDTFYNELMKNKGIKRLGFYGIAHTPLIFRLGLKVGDQDKIVIFHRKRNPADADFTEWTKEASELTINTIEENNSSNSHEMVVAISTSLRIEKSNIQCLTNGSKHILYLTVNNLGFDNITSYHVAENIRTKIMYDIRERVKKYDIRKLHIAISSSSAFTFFLAQAFSINHDPETTVYHFKNYTYPWGVCINKNADDCLVNNLQ